MLTKINARQNLAASDLNYSQLLWNIDLSLIQLLVWCLGICCCCEMNEEEKKEMKSGNKKTSKYGGKFGMQEYARTKLKMDKTIYIWQC